MYSTNGHVALWQRHYIFIFFLFVASLIPHLCDAQISADLHHALPDSLKPHNPSRVSVLEAQYILQKAFDIESLKSTHYDELDRLCYLFAPKYKSISDDNQRLRFLFFVCSYLYSSYAKHTSNNNTLRNDDAFYKTPHAETGLQYASMFLEQYQQTPILHPNWKGNIILFKSHFQMELGKYTEAHFTLENALTDGTKGYSGHVMVAFYNAISFLFESVSLSTQALVYCDSASSSLDKLPADEWSASMRNNIEQTRQKLLFQSYKSKKATALADSVLKIHHRIRVLPSQDTKLFLSSSHVIVSQLHFTNADYKKTLVHLDSAYTINPDFENTALGEQATAIRGISLIRLGRTIEGLKLLRTMRLETSIGDAMETVLQELYKHAITEGDYQSALHFNNLTLAYHKRRHLVEMQGKSIEMEQFYNVKASKAQLAQFKQLQARNNLLIGAAFVIVLLVLIFFIQRFITNKSKTKKLINKLDETIQLQISEIENVQDLERKRIGQQLHDDLASTQAAAISFLRIQGEEQSDSEKQKSYHLIADLLSHSYNKTRNKSHDLFLEENSTHFWDRLSDQIALLFSSTGIKFDFQVDISGVILPAEIKTAIAMILKEAITNIIKHAKATKTEILLYYDPGTLVLEIADNGQGFQSTHSSKGIGIKSIHERVHRLGGNVAFASNNKSGVTIKATFPFQHSESTDDI
jgi:signal transduction histidine kinase